MCKDSVQWYALRVRPHAERAAAEGLRVAGIEELLPLQQSRRRWSDRWKTVTQPLFPGYVFCHVALNNPYRIVSTPGVIGFAGYHQGPEPIPDEDMGAMKRMLDSERRLWPAALLQMGQRVRVGSGPLEGLEGRLLQIRNKNHLAVSLPILQRSLVVTLDGEEVIPYA